MTYDILATGSSGNAVVINGEILIDCGVSMKTLRDSGYIKSLKLVLLTNEHGDHFNSRTVLALHKERPALRFGCCKWMVGHLLNAGIEKRSIHVYELDRLSVYGGFAVKPAALPHDVQNCAYRIYLFGDATILYATDCASLDGIKAEGYDLYLIEANHSRAEIEYRIAEKQARGEFAYEARAARNHISQEQALDWLAKNAGMNSKYVFLHQHKEEPKHEN